ncbi:hypothetical protein A0H76_2353 [Hepatospora eriocheir]|uniref:Uncharacterized protein n=1 Tax=Hepatospora eriocheir TaxID=1081669 RepID=A0A1X0QFT3_9MICR|nr:hypothetical protein A0H76_2353 [Hepatospora eriocheir]
MNLKDLKVKQLERLKNKLIDLKENKQSKINLGEKLKEINKIYTCVSNLFEYIEFDTTKVSFDEYEGRVLGIKEDKFEYFEQFFVGKKVDLAYEILKKIRNSKICDFCGDKDMEDSIKRIFIEDFCIFLHEKCNDDFFNKI